MIIEYNGKSIAFGMQWKSRLSEGDVHRDARAAKSRYFWYADKAVYFGVLPELDAKRKLKLPLYSAAVALLHRFPDVPNLVMVLAIPKGDPVCPEGGFIVCGIHQSRPRSGYDVVLQTEVQVSELLKNFQHLCGTASFKLYGNVRLGGIEAATMDDVHKGAEQAAILRKTKSAMVNSMAFAAVGTVVISAAVYGYHTYSTYKKAEAHRLALASQKNSQQLYNEELAARRHDAIVLARDVHGMLAPLREMSFSIGGWALSKGTCTVQAEKIMACSFEYMRRPDSKGTYETFVAAAKGFDGVEFSGDTIKASKNFKSLPFAEQGKAIDAAKTQRDDVIEFGSNLQRLSQFGRSKRDEFQNFAIPPGAAAAELTTPPITVAAWEFTTPFRNMKHLATFPGYATVSQLVVTYTDKPAYEASQSLAMVTVTGKVFSKPN